MGRNGPLWATMGHNGPLWASMGHYGPQWATMGHYGALLMGHYGPGHYGVTLLGYSLHCRYLCASAGLSAGIDASNTQLLCFVRTSWCCALRRYCIVTHSVGDLSVDSRGSRCTVARSACIVIVLSTTSLPRSLTSTKSCWQWSHQLPVRD